MKYSKIYFFLPLLKDNYIDYDDDNIKRNLVEIYETKDFLTCSSEYMHAWKWDQNCKGFVVPGHLQSLTWRAANYLKHIGPKHAPELMPDLRLQTSCFPSVFPLLLRSLSQWRKEEQRRSASLSVVLLLGWKGSGGDQSLRKFKIKVSNHWLQTSGLQSVVLLLCTSKNL